MALRKPAAAAALALPNCPKTEDHWPPLISTLIVDWPAVSEWFVFRK